MKRNMKDWIASVIASKQRIAIPIMTHSGIELIGRTVYDAVTNGEIHYQAIQILSEKYPSAASSVIMDLTVEAEAFGAQVYFSENEIPSIVGRLVSTPEEIEKLKIPSLNTARLPEYIKATRLMAANASKPVLAGCIGPYSLSGRLYDMSEMMMAMYIDPDSIRLLLSKCTEFITSYCLALKDAGANGVFMAEPAAGLLSNEDCMEFSSRYIKQIVDAVQDDSFSVFLHNCGNTGQCTKAMVYTHAAGYHFGNGIDMVSALNECPKDGLVMGNIDPVSVFKMASPQQVYEQTSQLLADTAAYPNFVLSSGCDTPPEIPFTNITTFYQALNDYNATLK
ncbi:MAG TPA: uroporphyrinogen decarboxylase family protein [Candidatus Gallibacteroides avistercoris]|uniref:Uroporphyrinogen decarboxylase family protein n=1 Tax=Candidatus Gallibacteroides avistercoris TaxID=2840833 RepID=A0A9D1SCY4_9BACT|nr:uroporphyrinogen decarboxylase family protein [Candidatus Gallibacteroides avistercoris]